MTILELKSGQKFEFISGEYSGVAAEFIQIKNDGSVVIDPLDCDNRSLGLGKMSLYPEDSDEIKLVDSIS